MGYSVHAWSLHLKWDEGTGDMYAIYKNCNISCYRRFVWQAGCAIFYAPFGKTSGGAPLTNIFMSKKNDVTDYVVNGYWHNEVCSRAIVVFNVLSRSASPQYLINLFVNQLVL